MSHMVVAQEDSNICAATSIAGELLRAAHLRNMDSIHSIRAATITCPDPTGKIKNAYYLALLIADPSKQRRAFVANFPANGQEYWVQFDALAATDAWFAYHQLWAMTRSGDGDAVGKSMDGLRSSDGAFAEGFEYALEKAVESHPRVVLSVLSGRSPAERQLVICTLSLTLHKSPGKLFDISAPSSAEIKTIDSLTSNLKNC
jgi:hypothetical protein